MDITMNIQTVNRLWRLQKSIFFCSNLVSILKYWYPWLTVYILELQIWHICVLLQRAKKSVWFIFPSWLWTCFSLKCAQFHNKQLQLHCKYILGNYFGWKIHHPWQDFFLEHNLTAQAKRITNVSDFTVDISCHCFAKTSHPMKIKLCAITSLLSAAVWQAGNEYIEYAEWILHLWKVLLLRIVCWDTCSLCSVI